MKIFSRSRSKEVQLLSPVQQRKLARPISRAWLVHWPGRETGITHWLIVAKSLDEAFEQALDLPGDPSKVPLLGCVVDGSDWAGFARKPMKECCDICTPKGVIMQGLDERTWSSYAEQLAKQKGLVLT